MKIFGIVVCTFLLAIACFGQVVPSGQLSFNALNGPFGSAGVDIYGTYGVTTYGLLREDNFLFPGVNGSFYGAGPEYSLDKYVCPLVIDTNLNCNKFSVYVNAELGVGRTTLGSTSTNHVGGGFGFGIPYDPTGTGRYTINLIDFHEMKLNFTNPDFSARGWTTIASVGVSLGFGNNALASEAKLERVRAQQAKRLKKFQAKAAKAAAKG